MTPIPECAYLKSCTPEVGGSGEEDMSGVGEMEDGLDDAYVMCCLFL